MNPLRPVDARPFALVLAGGGARGYAHVGFIRGLEEMGLAPSGLVGVSMGAVVAATYALREDWYDALLSVDLAGLQGPPHLRLNGDAHAGTLKQAVDYAHAAWSLVTGWGAPPEAAEAGHAALAELLGELRLEEGRIPVVLCATDIRSGRRVELGSGAAASAAYASSALAGILPPSELGDRLLVDGVYSDVAPVDVARRMAVQVVIAVDPSQTQSPGTIRNGLQVLLRAVEICYESHAHVRLRQADLVVTPVFEHYIDVLEFGTREECVRAGAEAAARYRDEIERLVSPGGRVG